MALRTIRIMGDEVLTKTCREVTKVTPRISNLIDDMLETMYDACGVGLAAPQVGVLRRIVVIDVGEGPIVMINPVILETAGSQTGDEGCLSLPGKAGQVTRPNYVKARAFDENLEEFLMVALLIAMTVIMGIQVFCRYVLGMSLSWSEELTRYLFIWCGFLSVSYCSKKCLSIKIEQFVAIFPRRGKAIFKVVNHTFELIFFIYMIPFAYSYMMSSVHSGQLSPACGIPMYYVQAAPLVSFVLVTFRVLQRWIIEFRVARGENVFDPAHPERNTPESFIQANAESHNESALESGIDNRINTIKNSNEEEH